MALFAPGFLALVFAELLVAKSLEGLTLAPRLLKDPLLLISKILPAHQFALHILPLLAKRRLTSEREMQFGRGRSAPELQRLPELRLPDAVIHLVEEMPHLNNLLVGCAQTKFLLVLHALPEMKQGLQREMEGHVFSWAKPAGGRYCPKG